MLGCKNILSFFLVLISLVSFSQKTVDLSHQNLTEVPDYLKSKKELTSLILTGNPLKSLPEWLTELPVLKSLVLDEIWTLPVIASFKLLSNCPALTELSWQKGKLIFLPASISEFNSLRHLNLSHNGLIKLPLIKKDNQITHLNLTDNLIDTIGESILHFKKIEQLSLSFNPAVNNPHNFHLIKNLENLTSLSIKGIKLISPALYTINSLMVLDISESELAKIPKEFDALTHLTTLNLSHCNKINFSQATEQLAGMKNLSHLIVGGDSLNQIPFNVFKLRNLKTFTIKNSCINYVPASLSRLQISTLHLWNCSLNKNTKFFDYVSKIKSLKHLSLSHLCSEKFNLKEFKFIDSLDISHCMLTEIPTNLKTLKWMNLEGNLIPSETYKNWRVKIIGAGDLSIVKTQKITRNKGFNSMPAAFTKRIDPRIGASFSHQNITFQIPPHAFISKSSELITSEVIMSIRVITKPTELVLLNTSFNTDQNKVTNPHAVVQIKVHMHHEAAGFSSKEEVFINQKKELKMSAKSQSNQHLEGYYFSHFKNKWVGIPANFQACIKKQKPMIPTVFKSDVESQIKDYPARSVQVRNSKVELRLKRNKKRNTLKLELTPEYGYRENFFKLFGDKIKGYPELKTFKKVKWNYVGDSTNRVLKQLYFLSEQANSEKLKRKSSFYFYVLDIKNITIIPHPTQDHYLMQIVQGKDSVTIDVLPNLSDMSAKKIQKWHKNKHLKYTKKLAERILQWHKLDSLDLVHFHAYEQKLNEFRLKVIRQKTIPESNTNTAANENHSTLTKAPTYLTMKKTGWYLFGSTLRLLEASEQKLKIKLADHQFNGKRILVRNPKNNQTYWQPAKKALLSSAGTNYLYAESKGEVYVAAHTNKDVINLNKSLTLRQ